MHIPDFVTSGFTRVSLHCAVKCTCATIWNHQRLGASSQRFLFALLLGGSFYFIGPWICWGPLYTSDPFAMHWALWVSTGLSWVRLEYTHVLVGIVWTPVGSIEILRTSIGVHWNLAGIHCWAPWDSSGIPTGTHWAPRVHLQHRATLDSIGLCWTP